MIHTEVQNTLHAQNKVLHAEYVRILIRKLRQDTFLHQYTNITADSITFEGKLFYESGGYKKRREKAIEKRLREEQKELMQLKEIDSVINTNLSVETTNTLAQENFTVQKKFANRSLLLAVVSTLFIAVTAWMQYRDRTEQRIRELTQQVEKSAKALDSIRLSHKALDSSLNVFLERSSNKDR